jgi:hypothetical protein
MLGITSSEFDADDPAAAPPAADSSLPQPPSDAPAPAPAIRITSGKRSRRWLAALVIACVVGTGAAYYVMTGGHLFANVPPEGVIWFGTSFDPNSYDVRDRLTTVGPDEAFVMVGRLPRSLAGSRLVIRGYLDGTLIKIAWTENADEGAMWGFNLGPIAMPGNWRFELAEVGGNTLASGEFVVAE